MIILGLGSNIGDRPAHLRLAVQALSVFMGGMRLSRMFESKAVLPPDAPRDWDVPYLNMAVGGQCSLPPEALLSKIKTVEAALGRKSSPVWSPREIDIDILAMDDVVLKTSALTIPHPELLKRDFALIPLAEIAPGWKYPALGDDYNIPVEGIIADRRFAVGEHLRVYD